VSNLRFDEALVLGHGYDVDICLQARRAGRKVMTADIRVIEHRALAVVSELDLWTEAHIAFARKWEVPTPDWKARARRAEAEREASRAIAYFRRLGFDARVDALERELAAATSTFSWRLTKPLRRLNQWRRTR
jgi:GT2 family glycosyltransferase